MSKQLPLDDAKVLVADPTEGIRMMYGNMLKKAGYNVITTGSIAEAERMVRASEDLSLLITNSQGVPLVRKMREGRVKLPVLVASGGMYREEAMAAGANEYLQRPHTANELVCIVDKLVS